MTRFMPRLACACIISLSMLSASTCLGQVRRYQPSRPTVSPYLNLFRGNTGPLPNYYSLVRPQLYQNDFNQQQMVQQAQQTAALGIVQNQLNQQNSTTQTGKHSGFMVFMRQGFMTNSGRR